MMLVPKSTMLVNAVQSWRVRSLTEVDVTEAATTNLTADTVLITDPQILGVIRVSISSSRLRVRYLQV